MFCPFVKGECREDCAFRHLPRAASGNMINRVSACSLAILADELDYYIQLRTQAEEDQSS